MFDWNGWTDGRMDGRADGWTGGVYKRLALSRQQCPLLYPHLHTRINPSNQRITQDPGEQQLRRGNAADCLHIKQFNLQIIKLISYAEKL